MPKMDRAGFAFLVLLAVALVRISDSQRGTTGGRKEGAGAGRAVWDQQKSRDRNQGHSPTQDAASSASSNQTSGRSGTRTRLPRGASSQVGDRHPSVAASAHAAGASREDTASAPRDVAPRTVRHPISQQHRAKVNRRQSSRLSSASTRRLVG